MSPTEQTVASTKAAPTTAPSRAGDDGQHSPPHCPFTGHATTFLLAQRSISERNPASPPTRALLKQMPGEIHAGQRILKEKNS